MELEDLLPLVGAVIGGSLTLIGAKFAEKEKNKKEARLERRERFERMYDLCNQIYDRHKTEIEKFRTFEVGTDDDWLKNRAQPREVSSKLKMLVRMYEPTLHPALEKIDQWHAILNTKLIEIDYDQLKLNEKVRFIPLMGELYELGLALDEFKAEVIKLGEIL